MSLPLREISVDIGFDKFHKARDEFLNEHKDEQVNSLNNRALMNYDLLDDFAFTEAINNIFNSGRDVKTRFDCPLCGEDKIKDNHEYCCC